MAAVRTIGSSRSYSYRDFIPLQAALQVVSEAPPQSRAYVKHSGAMSAVTLGEFRDAIITSAIVPNLHRG